MPGVYISYPFCGQKCSFCNFASGVHPEALEVEYANALLSEIHSYPWEWTPDTVYFGGGTPSRMPEERLSCILDALPGRPWKEATMEAAPGTLAPGKLKAWRSAGINRVSLGVQSFVDRELRRTGRMHSAEVVASDCTLLRQWGLENINIDLIAGLPHQTRESWCESLDWIRRLSPPHVSVYLFEIDEDSRLGLEVLNHGSRYDARAVPPDDEMAEFYEIAVDYLAGMGLRRYEISNFARPGMESHHNLKYWRLEPYAGFGADAHSYDGASRGANVEAVQEYLDLYRRGLSPKFESTPAAGTEHLFVGLRLSSGIEPRADEWQRFEEPISRFIREGLLERNGGTLRLTARGVLLSNEVFQEFLPA
jgi:oxygen-independent coproporphyrinogen-3 oxidase